MSDDPTRLFPKITDEALDALRRASACGSRTRWSRGATRRRATRSATTRTASATTIRCGAIRSTRRSTRWGGIVALPSFLFATSRIISGYVGGLPGRARDVGRRRLDLASSRCGATTRSRTEAWLKDLIEHQTRFAGRAIQQIYHVDFFNQHGDLVAAADSWCFRTDRDQAREQGTKYNEVKARPPPHYTDEELARIYKLYAEEEVRGATPRYWRTSPTATACRRWSRGR